MSSRSKNAGVLSDRYEGLRTRSHWKLQDAERVLSDWAQSGESMSAFARHHGLGLHRLQWWRERIGKVPSVGQAGQLRLVPATVRGAPLIALDSGGVCAGAVTVLADGVRIEVADAASTDPRWVAALLNAVRGGYT